VTRQTNISLACLLCLFLAAGSAGAQTTTEQPVPALTPASLATVPLSIAPLPTASLSPTLFDQAQRPCDGCPPRSVGKALFQVTMVNVFYELANLIRGQDTAKITPKTWWTNMKRGWEWDLDDFAVNQIGHPYQGNNYFTTGRANGMNFWESAALTAFGSSTWEYFGETNQASLNDFINTTLGGIALGEMFYRTAWLVRNTSKAPRTMNEVVALAIDPMTGLNRFISGDAGRVHEKPPEVVPSDLGALMSAGVLGRGSNTDEVPDNWAGFFEADLMYGDLTKDRSRTPYDAFAVRLAFGGGSAFSEARVRGRLFSEPLGSGGWLLTVSQGYQYNNNDAYQFGAQSADVHLGWVKALSSKTSMFLSFFGGATILGAVDSVPPGTVIPEPDPDPDAGQGVSTGPRYYDYGPGANVGAFVTFSRNQKAFFAFMYELHHLHILDGYRAEHVLQRLRGDVLIPIKGKIGAGIAGEFFDRTTYYSPGQEKVQYRFPQVRFYMTWRVS
jgi:hypothetical protein